MLFPMDESAPEQFRNESTIVLLLEFVHYSYHYLVTSINVIYVLKLFRDVSTIILYYMYMYVPVDKLIVYLQIPVCMYTFFT